MRRSIKMSVLAATVAIAAVGLVGCTGAGASADQSVADACKVIKTEMSSFQDEMVGLSSQLTAGDPAAAKKAFDGISTKFDEIAGKIGNTEVKDALTGMSDVFGKVSEGLSASNPDPTLLTGLSDAASKMTSLCPDLAG